MGRIALFAIFVGVPILEIALFIQVGGLIGLWATLAVVIATALAGTSLMRFQGLQAFERLRASLENGRNPVGPIAHGALILIAGVLLLTPGFFTDGLGLALLIPGVRAALIRWGARRVTVVAMGGARRSGSKPETGDAIETEYEVLGEDGSSEAGRSGWTAHR